MMNNIFPKLHKEGYKFLAISIITTFIVWIFSNFLATILLLITIWVYYFFRDPDRVSINDNSYLVSPADGLITDISETMPKQSNYLSYLPIAASICVGNIKCSYTHLPPHTSSFFLYLACCNRMGLPLDNYSLFPHHLQLVSLLDLFENQ